METQKFNGYLTLEEIPRIIEIFLTEGEARHLVKDEIFLHQGQKSDLIGYVQQGGFRHLVRTEDDRERVAGYSFTGDFVMAFPAFEPDASAVTVQAIRDSVVFVMPHSTVQSRQTWEFRCRVAEVSLREVYGKLLLMHSSTPEERYLSLINHFPEILNEVPLKEIASYLRMTPETLSRTRKKILLERNS